MGVRIGHAGHHRGPRRVDYPTSAKAHFRRRLARPEARNAVTLDLDPARIVDGALVVDGDHSTVLDQDRHSSSSSLENAAPVRPVTPTLESSRRMRRQPA